jgi:hypothetical protein
MFERSSAWWQNRTLADPDWRRGSGGELQCAILEDEGRPAAYALSNELGIGARPAVGRGRGDRDRGDVFVVIDYPEAHRAAVRTLLQGAGVLERPPAKIRLLLVSRQPLSWWLDDIIAARASELCDSQESTVGPLDAAATCALVHQAATRLAKLPGTTQSTLDDAAIAAWHARNPTMHGLPLFATAAAVHAVLDRAATFELAGEDIIGALVRRERMRLEHAGQNAGWGAEAASRLHALAALRDGLDAAAVRRLAACDLETGLPQSEHVIDAIRSLGWWEDDRIPAPSPDIVAAELLHQILVDRPDRASDWLAAVLADPASLEIERLGRLAHDMATLHGPTTSELGNCLIQAVAHDPTRADLWRAILDTAASLPFRLAALAAKIGRTLLARPDLDETERASLLNNLSIGLSETGQFADALVTIREAVDIRRRLATANPARFEPDLAQSQAHELAPGEAIRLNQPAWLPSKPAAASDFPGVRRKTPARTFQGPLNPPARGRYGILLSRSATRLSRRDVVERERIVMVEPRRTGMSMSSSGSHATPRWREVDSNLRSPVSGDTPQRPLITSPSRAGPS